MKYRLTEKIGSGGMAEVFRAVGEGPQGFERPFVIKRIHPRLSEAPEFVRMFVDEAKISARLIHPNIVQVFEFAYQDGGYYIVMEPVEGMDMGWFRRRRAERRHELLPSTFVAEVGRQACRGLDFAHTLTDHQGRPLGIVHRDVTPPNIMVAWNGTVKILDFGIARAVQALRTNLTDAGMVKGKMSYVAPELLDGATADARSDIFSLGAVLHELLSGRQLFAGENDLETLKQVQAMPIPPPSTLNPGVKPALDGVVMRALERDPAKRYGSAGEMGDELEALVLRKSYSPRALARKARELVQAETPAPVVSAAVAAPGGLETIDEIVDPGPELAEEAPISIGREDSSVVVDEATPRRRATGRLPPPIGGRRRSDRRWTWLAIGAPTVVAAGLAGALARQPATPIVPIAAPAVKATLATTVQVALNSEPQGATVVAPAAGGGRRLGETPVLVELPRGQAAVELTLTKLGFAPLAYKVIPNRDKDVIARLEPATSAPRLVAARPAAVRPAARSPVALAAAAAPHARAVVAGSAPPRAGASAAPLPPAASPTRPTAPAAPAAVTTQQPAVHRPAWSGPSSRR